MPPGRPSMEGKIVSEPIIVNEENLAHYEGLIKKQDGENVSSYNLRLGKNSELLKIVEALRVYRKEKDILEPHYQQVLRPPLELEPAPVKIVNFTESNETEELVPDPNNPGEWIMKRFL